MKHLYTLGIITLLLAGVSGCGNKQVQNNSNKRSAKISSLKAENSSLKVKQHKADHHNNKKKQKRVNSNKSNSSSAYSSSSAQYTNQKTSAKQQSIQNKNSNKQIPATYYDEGQYRGSYKQNMTPQQRYDWDNWQVYYQNLTPQQQQEYQNQMANQH